MSRLGGEGGEWGVTERGEGRAEWGVTEREGGGGGTASAFHLRTTLTGTGSDLMILHLSI